MKVDLNYLVDTYKLNAPHAAARDIRNYFEQHWNFTLSYNGFVQAKERPRASKGGKMFTPPKTRAFEKAVENWAKEEWTDSPLIYPIRVELLVYDETANKELVEHSTLGLVYHHKNDVDNLGKSVLDGMNGVVYKDDKQIVDLRISRHYGRPAGFDVIISRAGLTKLEYTNFCKRMKK